ncbi:extracellular solute-binding protein [Corynebacterium epidermidicanis]|uniref:ABC-type Fe3+ transport system, periplasmic component n=1 Tax=Corynebacterium epidermidicanis TaxID=1050174 RepID=A0A0G3GT63_9CORY|nr:extracellular solute-binding protein [Corynebacterium epidermidicanis]AKK03730.1 ABC-type Fe3+ transport system, periplasmic component [Corynebacterium epidermidicanis]
MFKKSIAVTAALALTVSLSACSKEETTDTAPQQEAGGKLIVYTNSNGEGRADWLTQKAKAAGFDIQIVGQGGSDTTNKLLAEKGNPVADVVFGLNHMYFEQLEAEDVLVDYTPKWSGQVDEKLGDNDQGKSYWPVVQQGIVLAYNADKLPENEAPKDWIDLGKDAKFDGRYQSETGLGGATTALVLAGILTRYKDDKGEHGVSEEGWKQIENFFAKGSPAVKGKDLYARFAADEVAMGQMFTSGIPKFEKQYNVKTGVVKPQVGVPYAVEQVALVKGTKHEEQAKKFVDWFGSAELQSEWTKEFNSMPANQGAIEKTDPKIVEFHESLEQQDIDWDFVRANMSKWIEKIELEYLR